ncbi:hypothetical protein N9U55_00085 [Luminiphilus sp.]|nr:hypothetical protein [Luminiphilus sp.]MDA9721662.1 hypothetical protein [Luminiphilus sp.]
MLGPELLNMTVRPTPIFLEGTASLRIDQPGPRELGLSNFQIVKGLVSIDRGQLFINLAGVAQPLLAPDLFRRYAGQSIFFRVQLTPDGATILRPVPAAAATPAPPTTAAATLATTQLSGTPATILKQLMNPDSIRAMPPSLAAAFAGMGLILSPAMSIEAQIARARELLVRGGVLQLPAVESGAREAALPSLLMRLLGFGTDQATKERARGLLAEIDNRQDRAAAALRSDVINADILAWLNGAPVELNLQRGPRGNPPGSPKWIINFYTQFAENSDVWLRVEHAPANRMSIDAWFTDSTVFTRARDSRAELFAEVAEFGLQLEHFAVFNQARDNLTEPLSATSVSRLGDRLDSSV